jgi:LysM repeat protein
VTSLQEHLERHDLAASTIAFRRDCPLCRAERVQGQLPSLTLVSPRACAALTAVILATSSAAPAVVVADGQGVAVPAPPSPPPPPVTDVGAGGGGAAPAEGGNGEAGPNTPVPNGATGRPNEATQADAPTETSGDPAPRPGGDTGTSPSEATTPPGPPTTTDEGPPPDADRNGAHSGPPSTPSSSAPAPAAAPAPTAAESQSAVASRGGGQPPAASRRAPRPPASSTPSTQSHAGASPHRTGSSQDGRRARTSDRSPASTGSALARDTTPDGPRLGVSGGRDDSAETVPGDRRVRPARGGSGPRTQARVTAAESRPGATYRVQRGDSLWRIASRRLGADATDLQPRRR